MGNKKLAYLLRYGGLGIAVTGALLWYAKMIIREVQLISFIIGILMFIIGSYYQKDKL